MILLIRFGKTWLASLGGAFGGICIGFILLVLTPIVLGIFTLIVTGGYVLPYEQIFETDDTWPITFVRSCGMIGMIAGIGYWGVYGLIQDYRLDYYWRARRERNRRRLMETKG